MTKEIEQLNEWVKTAQISYFLGEQVFLLNRESLILEALTVFIGRNTTFPPETIISHSFFMRNPEYFYQFYRDKLLVTAQPNIVHLKLADWEKKGRLKAIVTQNTMACIKRLEAKTFLSFMGAFIEITV